MEPAVMVLGLVVETTAWWLVASRRLDVWRVMTPVLAAMGVAAAVVGPPVWAPRTSAIAAVGAGLAAGVGLYAATRAFVVAVRPWQTFRRHSVTTYRHQRDLSLSLALLLSVAVTVPGEELFWRGLFQPRLSEALDGATALAAVLAWAAYVVANLPSRNLAIVAGAVVGGAVWTGLGWWSGGVLAPLACHATWTALMLSFPVVRASEVPA